MAISKSCIALAFALVGLPSFACIVIPSPPPMPRPIPPAPAYLDVEEQHVTLSFEHPVVRTKVETKLRNPHPSAVEGTFVFPLPAGAAVTDFTFAMDGKPVAGEILPADKAKQIYLDIVRKMRDPALLEYADGGMFTARLFPVPPGHTSEISLEIIQNLKVDNNLVRYFHNVRVGRSEPPVKGKLVVEGTIHSEIPIKSVFSPTHEIAISRVDDHKVAFSCELTERAYDRDFVLYYGVAETEMGLHALTNRAPGEDGYFMLLMAPEARAETATAEKDVVFVIDTSGSMTGEKIEQAKQGLELAVQSLKPGDRFGLIAFATAPRALEEKLLPASNENVERAKRFVEDLEAVGGTALNDALIAACSMASESSARPAYVLLLTDGRPTVGERDEGKIIRNVAAANEKNGKLVCRIFLMGVGYDVNARLLDLVAEGNGGAAAYVRPGENLEMAISSLVNKIGHPVLTDVKLRFEGDGVVDVEPARMPDLFKGDQLWVTGRYTKAGAVKVKLTGALGGPEKRSWDWEVVLPEREEKNDFLPRLWATRRVGALLDEIRLHGEDEELKKEIVRLALKFGIVTPYTSYLVTEDEPRVAEGRPGVRAALRRGGGEGGAAPPAGSFAAQPPAAADAARQGIVGQSYGKAAVEAAIAAKAMREAEGAWAGADALKTTRYVGGKTFYLDSETGYWIDADYLDSLPEVTVKYLSERYAELCQKRPDIVRWLAVGEKVKVRVGSIGLVVSPDVVDNLTDGHIETLGQ